MKIGVLSDTHKHIVNLSKAVSWLKDRGVDRLVHLGDDYTDVDEIGERDVLRVPGVFSDFYQKEDVPNRIIENFAGWRFLLTHTLTSHANDLPGDLKPEFLIDNKQVRGVLYGHTHVPEIREEHGIIFLNPGHLKNEDKKGYPPAFGYVELNIDRLMVQIYRLQDYSILLEGKYRKK